MEAGNIEVTVDGRIAKAVATVKVGKRTHTIHAVGVGGRYPVTPPAYEALRGLDAMIDGYLTALNQYGKPMDVYLAMLATKGKANQMRLDVDWRE
jgi:hypothetical protein|tara:strand:+ start:267 stop:551 length:285 start_codon:yes stop_codon:yes gene_type:complete